MRDSVGFVWRLSEQRVQRVSNEKCEGGHYENAQRAATGGESKSELSAVGTRQQQGIVRWLVGYPMPIAVPQTVQTFCKSLSPFLHGRRTRNHWPQAYPLC